jgi:hypothetical protein
MDRPTTYKVTDIQIFPGTMPMKRPEGEANYIEI